MLDHVYLHTSNLDNIRVLREDPLFEPVYCYPREVVEKTSPNEYGMLKTRYAYYHILVGQIRKTNCPYCGGEPDLKIRTLPLDVFQIQEYWCQCNLCGAAGPRTRSILNIDNEEMKQAVFERSRYIFAHPKPWDDNIVGKNE